MTALRCIGQYQSLPNGQDWKVGDVREVEDKVAEFLQRDAPECFEKVNARIEIVVDETKQPDDQDGEQKDEGQDDETKQPDDEEAKEVKAPPKDKAVKSPARSK